LAGAHTDLRSSFPANSGRPSAGLRKSTVAAGGLMRELGAVTSRAQAML
jgi:hypothetical protein